MTFDGRIACWGFSRFVMPGSPMCITIRCPKTRSTYNHGSPILKLCVAFQGVPTPNEMFLTPFCILHDLLSPCVRPLIKMYMFAHRSKRLLFAYFVQDAVYRKHLDMKPRTKNNLVLNAMDPPTANK